MLNPIIPLLALSTLISTALFENTELKLVIELFRHGARRELSKLPRDLNVYPDPNTGYSDLTNTGYRAHYLLGRAVREKYADFLPRVYSQDVFKVYESNRNRTIESANSHMLGLFDLHNGEDIEFDDKDYYQPPIKGFPIEYAQKGALPNLIQLPPATLAYEKRNWMFTADSNCPKLKKQLTASADEIRNRYNSTFAPLYETLLKNDYDPRYYFKKAYYWIADAQAMCDYIYTRLYNDPQTIDPLLRSQCEYLLSFELFMRFSDEEYRSVYLNKMVSLIRQTLKDKAEGKLEDLKILILSGHDSNVAAFLDIFRPKNYECLAKEFEKKYSSADKPSDASNDGCIESINFTANVIMELHKDTETGQHEVRFLYNNNRIKLFNTGGDRESLSTVLGIFGKIADVDFEDGCGVDFGDHDRNHWTLIVCFLVATGLAVLLLVIYLILKRKVRSMKLAYDVDGELGTPLRYV